MSVERESAVINNTIILRIKFQYSSTSDYFDPYAMPKVEILDSNGTTVIETIVGAGIVKDATGQYHVVAAAITTAKTIYDKWYFTPNSTADAITKTNSCVVWQTISSGGTDFTFDTGTNLGKVRVLINDADSSSYALSDTKINALLALKSNDLFSTAALALYAMAASKALLAKRKVAGNYSEDLTAIAKECRETAKIYDDMAKNVPAEAVAEQFFTDFSYRELLVNKTLRSETD